MKRLIGFILLCAIAATAQFTVPMRTGAPTAAAPPAGCTSGSCSDSFTGAANTLLATHDSNWVNLDATYVVSQFKLTGSGTVQAGAWVQAGAIYNASSSDTSQVVFKSVTTSSIGERRVCVRAVASTTDGYCTRQNAAVVSGGTTWTTVNILKSGTQVSTASISLAAGSDHTVKIVASGTSTVTVTVYIDGTSVATYTDSTSPLGAGHPALKIVGNGSAANNTFGPWQDN